MKFVEFINNLKEQEINLYNNMVSKIEKEYKNTNKDIIENKPWDFWKYVNDNICADYDVQNTFRKEVFGESNYTNIERDIEEHISKLQKSVLKITGEDANIEQISDTEYLAEGNKADCTIKVTPAKLSSTKNIMKARIKVLNIVEHSNDLEEQPVQYEESEFVKQWKAKELQGYKDALQRWKEELKKLEIEREDKKAILRELVQQYIDKHNGQSPEVSNGKYVDETLHQAAAERNKADNAYTNYRYSVNRFFAEYGFQSNFEDICKKQINKHFEELQSKVENKIGRIIEIQSLGGDDYAFKGEKDKCVVEVVWAGGYNIQRLHTRWIVKNWNLVD